MNSLYHVTRKGERLAICQMRDSHLVNTIRMHCRIVIEAQKTPELVENKVLSALFKNDRSVSQEQRDNAICKHTILLQGYVAEAALRGLMVGSLLEYYQEAMGRSTGLGFVLPESTCVEEVGKGVLAVPEVDYEYYCDGVDMD